MRGELFRKLFIANGGEIAIGMARAACELELATAAVYSADDATSLHVRKADEAHALGRAGAAAYLDIERIVAIASAAGCDAIHPGYGFLSENANLARRAAEEEITFVGPSPGALQLFGDKIAARKLAVQIGVPVIEGTTGPTSLDEALAFFETLDGGAMMIKAVSGGGGRGMRAVRKSGHIAEAYARCRSEAKAAFGDDTVYVERLVEDARHIEVQIVGDRAGAVTHFGERECTIQRRNQKLIEIAPSPSLTPGLRARILHAALKLAGAARYDNLGTFEFLADASDAGEGAFFAFIEANPRLQVEHTVTEELMGIDLAATQLRIAAGQTLASLGLAHKNTPHGFAIQLRVNMETMDGRGDARPSSGTLTAFDMPSGPGVRVDSFGYTGYRTSTSFDSLLAKLIVHSASPDFAAAVAKAYRAARETRIDGVGTNISFLQALLKHKAFAENRVNTRFVEDHIAELVASAAVAHPHLFFESATEAAGAAAVGAKHAAPAGPGALAGPLQSTGAVLVVRQGGTGGPGGQS